MKRKKRMFLALFGVIGMVGIFWGGQQGRADDFWDEDDADVQEIFEDNEWEAEDSFDIQGYSYEVTEDGVKIVSCQLETIPEKIRIPSQVSYEDKTFPVTEIGEEAFSGIAEVKEIEIPEGIFRIGDYAFGGCGNLEEIHIPESLIAMGEGVFSECYVLQRVDIHTQNKYFSFSGNCLYQNGTTLIWCSPEAEEAVLKEDTKTIAEAAFSGCQFLTELEIPSGVTTIKENALEACSSLNSIYFREQDTFQLMKHSLPDIWNCTIYVESEEIKHMVESSGAYEEDGVSVVVKKQYALQYECNGGSLGEGAKATYWNTEAFLLPEPYKEGFLFKGWSESAKDEETYVTSYGAGTEGDRTLYAIWETDTDAEDDSLLNEDEQKLLVQKDSVGDRDFDGKRFRKNLVSKRQKQQNVKTDKKETVVAEVDKTESSLIEKDEAAREETPAIETTQDMGKAKQVLETKTAVEGTKCPPYIVALLIAGILCVAVSLAGIGYIYLQEKKDK